MLKLPTALVLLALTIGAVIGPAQAAIDGLQYIASYPDLIRAFGADPVAGQAHYERYGRAEGRSPDSFDERQYLASYADLRAAFGTDGRAATIHYIQRGFTEGRTDKVNVVVMFADDLGWGEVGARHVGDVPTPNIDAIAQAGVTFTDAYATSNLCAPSRAGLLTGRYQQEFGIYGNPGSRPYPSAFGLPADQTTLAGALKARGYVTGMVGKWHLGMKAQDNPIHHGFDEFFGVLDTNRPYYGEDATNPILRGTVPVPASGYFTDTRAAEAGSFIRRHAGRPFFLYVPFTATHTPLAAKPEMLARLASIRNPQRRLFAAVLASLDEGVGTIRTALREAGVAERTVVVFLGDNGCNTGRGCRNAPLRGAKGTWWEGGIRVPMVMAWPSRVGAGGSYARPVMASDLFATFLRNAGGIPPAAADGVDLLPFLQGAGGEPHGQLFWGNRSAGAVRRGDWKLLGSELFNLATDLGEQRNLAAANPAIVAELRAARAAWARGLARPLW
ncbi:MAG: sulfatase-like hydrolase/transferase [Geminicoccaceae bacterium]